MAEPAVLLHGFTQTGAAWDGVRAAVGPRRDLLTPDLAGHGSAAGRRPIDTATLVEDVLSAAPERFVLGGYSMGARLALHVAVAAPERVSRLVLVSATAGIEDEGERAARRRSDAELATLLETRGIEPFAERWERLPLFAGQPDEARAAARAMRLAQDPAGLAASLRGFGAGTMPAVWDQLGELEMPATVLVGERDARYRELGARLAPALPQGRLVVVPGVGHALPLEAASAVADALLET